MALCFLLSCRLGLASDLVATTPQPVPPATTAVQQMPPATVAPIDAGTTGGTPAMMALPVDSGSAAENSTRKWYTISVSLRETYDDNVNTTSVNKRAALQTSLSPSFLVNFPSVDGDFSARATVGLSYYEYLNNGPGSGTNGGGSYNSSSYEYNAEMIAQYLHAFSERFNLNAAENLRYHTDPSILQSTGTNFQNGPYIANTLNGTLTAQWTPLLGSTTTYSNTIVNYEKASVADLQNSVENTGTQSIGFAILPKISLNFGGIVDNVSYQTADRGYTSYTAFTGLSWAALPTLNISGRGGATYTQIVQSALNPGASSDSISPYGALSIAWNLGAKSVLSFDYAHEITPTEQAQANGQSSDRVSANFSYSITPSLSTHLQGIYTLAEFSSSLSASSSISGYTETSYALDTGITYHYNNFLDFDADLTTIGVSSGIPNSDYTRDQVSIGVRGTY